MPRWVAPALALLGALALVPVAFVARSRVVTSQVPRVDPVQDMDNQGKFKAQQANALFADGRAMRPHIEGTVGRGMLRSEERLYRGIEDGEYSSEFPVVLNMELLERGQARFEVFCAPCHGLSGYGDGMVSRRADRLQQGTWVPPTSLHDELALSRPVGHLFNTITNGIRNMPGYGSQIPVKDRWAVVAYVRALQRSQRTDLEDVPPEKRDTLR